MHVTDFWCSQKNYIQYRNDVWQYTVFFEIYFQTVITFSSQFDIASLQKNVQSLFIASRDFTASKIFMKCLYTSDNEWTIKIEYFL